MSSRTIVDKARCPRGCRGVSVPSRSRRRRSRSCRRCASVSCLRAGSRIPGRGYYITAMITEVPLIAGPIDGEPTQERIELTNSTAIENTANFKTVRGYTLVSALCDEIAFWQGDDSANPDVEILAALRPAMTTMAPDAMLLCASSPHARRGALWDAYRKFYGKEDALEVLLMTGHARSDVIRMGVGGLITAGYRCLARKPELSFQSSCFPSLSLSLPCIGRPAPWDRCSG
jgi:hypothetical protein